MSYAQIIDMALKKYLFTVEATIIDTVNSIKNHLLKAWLCLAACTLTCSLISIKDVVTTLNS